MADRIAVMHQGQLEQLGTPAEIYTEPKSTFVAAFIGEMNILQGNVIAVLDNRVRVTADTLDFELPLRPGKTPTEEQAVVLCLRAERIKMRPQNSGETISDGVTATLEFVTFMGASTLYLARPEGGSTLLKINQANTAGRPLHARGERVQLTWEPESIIYYFQE